MDCPSTVYDGVYWVMPKWGAWEPADYATEEALEARIIPDYPPEDDDSAEHIMRQDDWRYE